MNSITLSDKQMTFILLALEAFAQQLKNDIEDPGPSMADALYVTELKRKLQSGELLNEPPSAPAHP